MRFPFAALLVCVAANSASAQATFRYSLVPGTSFTQEWTQEQKVIVNVMGQEAITLAQFQSDLVWSIKKVSADKNIQLGLRLDKPRYTFVQGDKKTVIDDESDAGDTRYRLLKTWLYDLARAEIACVVTPDGAIESAALPAATLERLKKLPQADTMPDLFSEEGLKRMIGQALPPVPSAPVEKGSNWRQRIDMQHPFGKLTTDLIYTYLEAEGKKLKVGIKSAVRLSSKPGSPASYKIKLNETSGQGVFDSETGRWLELSHRDSITLVEELGNFNVEYLLFSDVTIKLKK